MKRALRVFGWLATHGWQGGGGVDPRSPSQQAACRLGNMSMNATAKVQRARSKLQPVTITPSERLAGWLSTTRSSCQCKPADAGLSGLPERCVPNARCGDVRHSRGSQQHSGHVLTNACMPPALHPACELHGHPLCVPSLQHTFEAWRFSPVPAAPHGQHRVFPVVPMPWNGHDDPLIDIKRVPIETMTQGPCTRPTPRPALSIGGLVDPGTPRVPPARRFPAVFRTKKLQKTKHAACLPAPH